MAVTRADGPDFDSKNAGADLSEKLFFLAHMDTDGDLVLAGAGEAVYGVIVEPGAANEPVTVQVSGLAKAIAGGSITAGQPIEADGDGKAAAASGAGSNTFGIARNSADAGDMVEILIDRSMLHA